MQHLHKPNLNYKPTTNLIQYPKHKQNINFKIFKTKHPITCEDILRPDTIYKREYNFKQSIHKLTNGRPEYYI